jgi:muconolactone D-isomerase
VEFLIHMQVGPIGDADLAAKLLREEAERSKALAADGVIRRLWRVPGRRENWGIWVAQSIDELHTAIASLPLYPYLNVTIHILATHPNDPGLCLEKASPIKEQV